VVRQIEPVAGGAVADFGRCVVDFPYALDPSTPVAVTTPRGEQLAFRPTYLVLGDRSHVNGNYLLARVRTNSVGEIVSPTEVLYTNALEGIDADIKYVYRSGLTAPDSLEQFLILHQDPSSLFPTNLDPTRLSLELWTEWFDSQPLAVSSNMIVLRQAGANGPEVDAPDYDSDFGTMRLVAGGRAFGIGAEEGSLPVAKSWADVSPGGTQSGATSARRFLIETVDYEAAKPSLNQLEKAPGHAWLRPRSRPSLLAGGGLVVATRWPSALG
jgi:hypothetical protein